MSEEWKEIPITVKKVKSIADCIDDALGQMDINVRMVDSSTGRLEREINDKDNQIVKLKRQVSQLLERCEEAEKPNEMEWVEILWPEAQDGDFISYVFGDNDSPLWRAEERESMNENGIVLAGIEKLDAMMKESEEE